MDDLRRLVFKGPAKASCGRCGVLSDGVSPGQAGKAARKHARKTGHITAVRYTHTTEYTPQDGEKP